MFVHPRMSTQASFEGIGSCSASPSCGSLATVFTLSVRACVLGMHAMNSLLSAPASAAHSCTASLRHVAAIDACMSRRSIGCTQVTRNNGSSEVMWLNEHSFRSTAVFSSVLWLAWLACSCLWTTVCAVFSGGRAVVAAAMRVVDERCGVHHRVAVKDPSTANVVEQSFDLTGLD